MFLLQIRRIRESAQSAARFRRTKRYKRVVGRAVQLILRNHSLMTSAAEICNYCWMEGCEPVLAREQLEEGAVLLRGFAAAEASLLIREVELIAEQAAFRHWVVPAGHTMSVAMTNCGRVGWVSNRSGYRY